MLEALGDASSRARFGLLFLVTHELHWPSQDTLPATLQKGRLIELVSSHLYHGNSIAIVVPVPGSLLTAIVPP